MRFAALLLACAVALAACDGGDPVAGNDGDGVSMRGMAGAGGADGQGGAGGAAPQPPPLCGLTPSDARGPLGTIDVPAGNIGRNGSIAVPAGPVQRWNCVWNSGFVYTPPADGCLWIASETQTAPPQPIFGFCIGSNG